MSSNLIGLGWFGWGYVLAGSGCLRLYFPWIVVHGNIFTLDGDMWNYTLVMWEWGWLYLDTWFRTTHIKLILAWADIWQLVWSFISKFIFLFEFSFTNIYDSQNRREGENYFFKSLSTASMCFTDT